MRTNDQAVEIADQSLVPGFDASDGQVRRSAAITVDQFAQVRAAEAAYAACLSGPRDQILQPLPALLPARYKTLGQPCIPLPHHSRSTVKCDSFDAVTFCDFANLKTRLFFSDITLIIETDLTPAASR